MLIKTYKLELDYNKILDRFILKNILLFKNSPKKSEVILFYIIVYLFIFWSSVSLKSIELSVRIYNLIKIIVYTKQVKYSIKKFIDDETKVVLFDDEIVFYKWKISIKTF